MRARLVVGFMFCGPYVLLVLKQKPSWQKGLWNGVGGKCELLQGEQGKVWEQFPAALVREFKEETGLDTTLDFWTPFAREIGPEYELVCFKGTVAAPPGVLNFALPDVPEKNDAGEPLYWTHLAHGLPRISKIGNLNWLIPLAQDWRRHTMVEMQVQDDIREKAGW